MNAFAIVYFVCCLIVGLFGLGKRGGFLTYFMASMVATPVLTLIFMIYTTRNPKSRSA